MKEPEFPRNEQERLTALCGLEVLDTPAEERFDRLTRLVKHYFDTPIVLVSLVDTARQWFKSRQGLDASETPRNISFCGHAILSDDVFYVPNALEDKRFADNPLVTGPPEIRFYAGAPLSTQEGYKLGTLCIIDTKPRNLTDEDLRVLREFADLVEAELNQVRVVKAEQNAREYESRLHAVIDAVVDGIITIDSAGHIQSFNPAAERIFGYTEKEIIGQNVKILMPEPYQNEHDGYLNRYQQGGEPKIIGIGREVEGLRKDGTVFPLDLAVSEMKINGDLMFTGIG